MIRSLSPLALALLAGCARDETAFPSLAPRAAELRGFSEPAVASPAPAVPDPSLDEMVRTLDEATDAARRVFDVDLVRAEQAARVPAARTVGSDAWLAAQAALAALDDARARLGETTTRLDEAARDRLERIGAPYPPLETARARATAESERQATATAAVTARVPQP